MKELSKEQQALFDQLRDLIETSLKFHNTLNMHNPSAQLTWEEMIEKLQKPKK